jgi:hypothetical protein
VTVPVDYSPSTATSASCTIAARLRSFRCCHCLLPLSVSRPALFPAHKSVWCISGRVPPGVSDTASYLKDCSLLVIERVRKNPPGPGAIASFDLTVDVQVLGPKGTTSINVSAPRECGSDDQLFLVRARVTVFVWAGPSLGVAARRHELSPGYSRAHSHDAGAFTWGCQCVSGRG